MQKTHPLRQLLDAYHKQAFSQSHKGTQFEQLMLAYLQTEPMYKDRFEKVWLWQDFPARKDFGGKDTGIDLVAQEYNGDYWAVQCKFYAQGTTIDKPSVDTFISTSEKKFADQNLQTTQFRHRLWIDTTGRPFGKNAEEAVRNLPIPFHRIGLYDLMQAPVDWDALAEGNLTRITKKSLFPHQIHALQQTHTHLQTADRGKLIMACGTGKTFTSLKIAENETGGKGFVLFLVPSIALLGQTLREWTAESDSPIHAVCICSDAKASKKTVENDNGDMSVIDLALPASTDVENVLRQLEAIKLTKKEGMTVVFSTYQSIEVIAKVQQALLKQQTRNELNESSLAYGKNKEIAQTKDLGIFDLIICDEAHRTTGITLAKEDESAFVKVHNNDFLKARKRLYMTATPRLYGDEAKSKADRYDAVLCSMDDTKVFGEEIYRIGFGEAVERGLLTEYKVLILTLNEMDIPEAVQEMVAKEDNEISTDDVSKLIGCINAFSKQVIGDDGTIANSDPQPMRSVVAFANSIKNSQKVTDLFNALKGVYYSNIPTEKKEKLVAVASKHVDGTMQMTEREEKLSWLKNAEAENECKILTNARCLSEGVDVPALDAVVFLSSRDSQVDVVQSVGRVMRKAPNKKYGYIIIPVVIPSNISPDQALDDNKRYKIVWDVLNALRAHDDRFNATINQIELNRKKPDNITVVGTDNTGTSSPTGKPTSDATKVIQEKLALQFQQLQGAIFAKIVQKVGDRRYWETWAKDVAIIAEKYIDKITHLVQTKETQKKAFADFLAGLHKNLNPSISQSEAIEMLAQHLITKPVFEALFEGYSFVKHNPVSISMEKILETLENQTLEKDTETLQKFYDSVKKRASNIDNAVGKQKIIVELYDKFFKNAFPKMVEKLGIVYTPTEVVDFIIHSVDALLKKEFGRNLTDENIHILDPFTGTGTFMTRLLQSGLIKPEDLLRKYKHELHANELVLLAYYIATVNIENAFFDLTKQQDYVTFEGAVLTDTFQLSEKTINNLFPTYLQENSDKIEAQKKAPLRVIIGNPPYSVGQKSANDNAQNQKYEYLEKRIDETYASKSNAGLNKSNYDSYIKAFRWASDRLSQEHGGIIGFVTNGSWLDGNSTDGFRKVLEQEFTSIYVFNLRGNQRTSGELSRKEGGKIFGSGSRTPVCVTFLVKNPNQTAGKATIHYYDIGDYLSREEKLAKITKLQNIDNIAWQALTPNEHADWLSQRSEGFDDYIALEPEKKFDVKAKSFFIAQGPAIATGRDAWVYNFSKSSLEKNMKGMIDFYNEQQKAFVLAQKDNSSLKVEDFINTNPVKISWTVNLKKDVERSLQHLFVENDVVKGNYRPFCKEYLYFNNKFIERPGLNRQLFPNKKENLVISVSGIGSTKDFSTLISNIFVDYQYQFNTQCFPLYYYEEVEKKQASMFDSAESDYVRRDAVSDFILGQARARYGNMVGKEDIFYYVYGFLHSPTYRETFANDLKKMLPRLPLVEEAKDFWAFSKAGRALADLHLNYETQPKPAGVVVLYKEGNSINYQVEKMRFPSKDNKTEIQYNAQITISQIPLEAYDYVVNGKSAIEWIMERYQITTHKESQITNNPNDWATEVGNEKYILELLLSVITVSLETMKIVKSLPEVSF